MARIQILEGKNIYEDGELKGPFSLHEGERAGPFIILESVGGVSVVEPTKEELQETSIGRDKGKHLMTLEGRFQMSDTPNANNRIYPNSIWEKVFGNKDILTSVDRGEMLGEADHPRDGETRLGRVAGKVSKLWRNPENLKEVMGRFVVFDNEAGRNLKAIHDGGGRLGVSSRGQGSVVRVNGKDVVQEDYKLQTWDVVHGPSTPGAYPEEVTESTKPATQQENDMSKRLEELESRLQKLRGRDLSKLSPDAVDILKEQATEIQQVLTEESFGEESPKAAKLVVETTNFLTEAGLDRSEFYDKKGKTPWGDKPKEDKKKDEKEVVQHYGDPESQKVRQAAAKNRVMKKRAARADTKEAVVEMVKAMDLDPVKDIQEALKAIRKAYREAVEAEGPLTKQEVSGVNEAAKAMVERAAKLDEECPVIKAWVGNTSSQEGEVVEARSEGELREKIKALTEKAEGRVYVNIDRSEQVYADCAKRFSGLLEAQTLKAEKVIREKADAQASITELSAKLTGATRLLEAFATKCKLLESDKMNLSADVAAACKILEEMPKEVHSQGIKGAVIALAASHPKAEGLGEALASSGSIEEAISSAKSITKTELPKIDREPTHDDKVNEALKKNEELQEQLLESKVEKKKDPTTQKRINLTKRVVERIRQTKSGK
jgi:hypothetical protein